jgi:hypothetical protein
MAGKVEGPWFSLLMVKGVEKVVGDVCMLECGKSVVYVLLGLADLAEMTVFMVVLLEEGLVVLECGKSVV